MREPDTMRRTGRDRRDAGAWRAKRIARRRRDRAMTQARALKGLALAWVGEDAAASRKLVIPILAADAATSSRRSSSMHPVSDQVAEPSSDLSWLPGVGAPVVFDGVRISAVEVGGGSAEPFYVLAAAD